ncbi:MAG: PEP-CTERM sorting domain-containing protein [Planctomycetota bacterium]
MNFVNENSTTLTGVAASVPGDVLVASGATRTLAVFSVPAGSRLDVDAIDMFSTVTVVSVPEPATAGLFALAGAAALRVRRRRA